MVKILTTILTLLIITISILSYGIDSKSELTHDVQKLNHWIIESGDNNHLPFIIIDKKETKVFVFDASGKIYGSTIALVGATLGDDVSPGVGKKEISSIRLEERTTQAGRFHAQIGKDINQSGLLWIDYDSGLSMHPVITSNKLEQRLRRLTSIKISERRITYGCVNVPSEFYQEIVHSSFENNGGIVYILPEIHSILKVFGPDADRYSQQR